MSPTEAFDALASTYQKFRPGYPRPLLDRILEYAKCGSLPPEPARIPIALDVGAGTGISTRLLREVTGRAVQWIGVEPGEGMRTTAVSTTAPELEIQFVDGAAEALPFASSSVAWVCAAQAVQWFDRPRFYAEAARVLVPGGTLAVLQNNRDWRGTSWLDAYETFLEQNGEGYSRFYRSFSLEKELAVLPEFGDYRRYEERWTREMAPDEFVGLSLSSTKVAPVAKKLGRDGLRDRIHAIIREHLPGAEQVPVRYSAQLYLVRKQK